MRLIHMRISLDKQANGSPRCNVLAVYIKVLTLTNYIQKDS